MSNTISVNTALTHESDIIRGCLEGKRSAQEALYRHFSAKMFAVCLRYSSDYHSAEDILQEGFVRIFQNLDRYRGDGSFEGWMKRIFINTAIETFRKTSRIDYEADMLKVDTTDLSDDAFSTLNAKDLMEMVQNLSAGYRTVFNLYAIEGFPHKEIAEMLGISEGTSKSQISRARQMLQKMMRDKI